MNGAASTLAEAPKPVYTQCSKCETVFKLSAEVLRAAGGQVRCGKCGEVFNALARLAEDSSAFEPDESALELETRADNILESAAALPLPEALPEDNEELGPPGVEIARLEILDLNDEDELDQSTLSTTSAAAEDPLDVTAERSLEFTLPPGELDRIFVESKMRLPAPREPRAEPIKETPLATQASPPASVSAPSSASAPASASAPSSASASAPAATSASDAEQTAAAALPVHPQSVPVVDRRMRSGVTGGEVSEDVRRQMLGGIDQQALPATLVRSSTRQHTGRRTKDHARPAAPRRPFMLWLAAGIVSALLLSGQVLHHNREWFAAHGPLGAAVRSLYKSLGAPVPAPTNLSAYQLRQWGVTGDPAANGTLRVRASILNVTAQLQPFPLLRVTLANRFGSRIGARDFGPSEYLGKQTARLLAPGERVDATLDILDPGKNAEGFEIDVCLRGADQTISCGADVAPQVKR